MLLDSGEAKGGLDLPELVKASGRIGADSKVSAVSIPAEECGVARMQRPLRAPFALHVSHASSGHLSNGDFAFRLGLSLNSHAIIGGFNHEIADGAAADVQQNDSKTHSNCSSNNSRQHRQQQQQQEQQHQSSQLCPQGPRSPGR